jgi:hypothetical protein
MAPKELKEFAYAILTVLLLALLVGTIAVYHKPVHGQEKAPIGETIFAMVKISQPLLIDDKVFEDHEIAGSLYADGDACLARAKEEMQKNAVEVATGTAKFRVFAGCISIPAPGKGVSPPVRPPRPSIPMI